MNQFEIQILKIETVLEYTIAYLKHPSVDTSNTSQT